MLCIFFSYGWEMLDNLLILACLFVEIHTIEGLNLLWGRCFSGLLTSVWDPDGDIFWDALVRTIYGMCVPISQHVSIRI